MPILLLTANEYDALGPDKLRAIEAAGQKVVIVDNEEAAERAARASGAAKETAGDVSVSFVPVSGEATTNTPPDEAQSGSANGADAGVPSQDLLRQLVDLQRQMLAALHALNASISAALPRSAAMSTTGEGAAQAPEGTDPTDKLASALLPTGAVGLGGVVSGATAGMTDPGAAQGPGTVSDPVETETGAVGADQSATSAPEPIEDPEAAMRALLAELDKEIERRGGTVPGKQDDES